MHLVNEHKWRLSENLVWVQPYLLIVGRRRFLSCPLLALRAPSEEDVVDQSILEQGQEDKDEAAHQVNVDGFDIWDLWECLSQVGVDCGHSQYSCYAWGSLKENRKTIMNASLLPDNLLCVRSRITCQIS